MRLTFRQLQIFMAIAETGSTTAAGQSIALTQSATSAALKELEGLLGANLFDRVGKRLVLNDNGRTLVPQARWLIDGAAEVEGQFARQARSGAGPLCIGASTTIGNYLMPRLLAAYGARADISQISIRIGNTGEIAAAVAAFELDVGFIEGPCHESRLTSQPWIRDELVLFGSANHPLFLQYPDRPVPVAALRDAQWLLREPGSGTREAVEHALLPKLHHLKSGIAFGNSEAIKRATAQGLGLSCLSRWVIEDMVMHGELRELRTTFSSLSRLFHVIRHPQKYISRNLESFIRFSTSAAWQAPAAVPRRQRRG